MRRAADANDAGRRGRLAAGVLALLVGALLAGVAPAALAAKPHTGAKKTAPASPSVDDGLGPNDVLLVADQLADDHTTTIVTADGHVELRSQGRTLRADKVLYNRTTGATHAYGHVVIVEADGSTTYASEAELDDQARAGLELGFSGRLANNVTIVAASSVRRNDEINTFHHARITPCDICAADGSPIQPTLSIEARTIVEDRAQQIIYYRHAVIRIRGVPVMVLPFFWQADPTADRRSGFLSPKVEYSGRRGLSYEQPYLFSLSPYSELIVDPQFNQKVNPLLNIHYREQFNSGLLDVRAGVTEDKLFDNDGKFGDNTVRSYLLAKGAWQLDPRFTTGFGIEQVTDPTFFQRYSVHQLYQDRGPFRTDTSRLLTQLYAVRQDSQSYISISALDYQSLRVTESDKVITSSDDSSAFPIVGPLVEARYAPAAPVFGGQLRLQASAVELTRNNLVMSVADPTGLNPAGPQSFVPTVVAATATSASYTITPTRPTDAASLTYTSSRRISGQGDWRTDITFDDGMRVSPFLQARGDLYSIDNGILSTGTDYSTLVPAKSFIARGQGTVGFDASWPFFRPLGGGSIILEPLVEAAVSPKGRLNPNIPNEDSASFEFDDTTLFTINRFSGYDLEEGGARMDVGGRATADFGGGRSASFTMGRVFRTENELVFNATSGLQGKQSDWITAFTITPLPGLSLFNRTRSDSDTWKVHADTAGVNLSLGRDSLSLRYNYDESGVEQVECSTSTCVSPNGGTVLNGSTVITRIQNAQISGTMYMTKHWGLWANVTRDVQNRLFPVSQLSLFYQDECMRLDILYTHDEIYGNVIGTSNSVILRLTLATLGVSLAPGVQAGDSR